MSSSSSDSYVTVHRSRKHKKSKEREACGPCGSDIPVTVKPLDVDGICFDDASIGKIKVRRGPRGYEGPMGPIGYTGYTGYTGPTGPSGEAGLVGALGPTGPRGGHSEYSFYQLKLIKKVAIGGSGILARGAGDYGSFIEVHGNSDKGITFVNWEANDLGLNLTVCPNHGSTIKSVRVSTLGSLPEKHGIDFVTESNICKLQGSVADGYFSAGLVINLFINWM